MVTVGIRLPAFRDYILSLDGETLDEIADMDEAFDFLLQPLAQHLPSDQQAFILIDAIDEGDHDSLREDVLEAFSDEQIEEIERRIDSVDFADLISEILDEWGGDEVDELFELLESHLAEVGIELKRTPAGAEDDDEDAPAAADDDEDDDEVGFVEDTEEEL